MSNFIYRRSVTHAWRDLVKDLLVHGERVVNPAKPDHSSATREIFGYGLTLAPGSDWIVSNQRRKADWAWACMEVLWYLSLSSDIRPLLLLAPGYKRFVEDGSDLDAGAYGRRWMHNTGHDHITDGRQSQLASVHALLTKEPDSRQAVVTMWDSLDLGMVGMQKNAPCTLSMQFAIRPDGLRCQANMRSNDAWIGFIYDTFAFRVVQRLMAEALRKPLGHYYHVVGSMHLYEKNTKAAEEALVGMHSIETGFCSNHVWSRSMGGERAQDIIYREEETFHDDSLLSLLMRYASEKDKAGLERVARTAHYNATWFDYLIEIAAEGCITKLETVPC